MIPTRLFLALTVMIGACGGDAEPLCEGDVRLAREVYHGTLQPSYVPLSPAQQLAIGDLNHCSGTLIAPSWVLSAKHCNLRPGDQFCMGERPDQADACVRVNEVFEHPFSGNDLVMAELVDDARVYLPEVEPIPIMTDLMDGQWIGRLAEAAGYGETDRGEIGVRYYTAQPIVRLSDDFVTIDGEGQRGLCSGDSGGPVMIIADDATVRVAGALYGGAITCVGEDHFTRTDLFVDWIEQFTGPTVVGEPSCGRFDAQGQCLRNVAVWCEDDSYMVMETCEGQAACGWDVALGGFRCIEGDDPCGGHDRRGGCDGQVARWCESGEPRSRDCGACGMVCDPSALFDGAYCRQDPCEGLDFLGHCDDNVAEWCEGGEIVRVDCSATDQTCQYINDQLGYFCL